MKQKNIAIVIVVIVIAGTLSYFISKKLFAKPQDRSVQVKTVQKISTDFTKPHKKYYNETSINPTQTITIGDNQDKR